VISLEQLTSDAAVFSLGVPLGSDRLNIPLHVVDKHSNQQHEMKALKVAGYRKSYRMARQVAGSTPGHILGSSEKVQRAF
jgi:hypothetical protein